MRINIRAKRFAFEVEKKKGQSLLNLQLNSSLLKHNSQNERAKVKSILFFFRITSKLPNYSVCFHATQHCTY